MLQATSWRTGNEANQYIKCSLCTVFRA